MLPFVIVEGSDFEMEKESAETATDLQVYNGNENDEE